MANWKMKLYTGKRLRELIDTGDTSEENCQSILNQIVTCYDEIKLALDLDDDWLNSEIDELQDDIECAAFDEETVDYHLRNFYDICDALRVWVEM